MPPEASLEPVRAGRNDGWLRPIDAAFADFLRDTGVETDQQVLLLGALVSQQLGEGHICLELASALARPGSLTPFAGIDPATTPAGALKGLDADTADRRLRQSPVVDVGPGQAPLVLDSGRLYLRRYWDCEQLVARHLQRLVAERYPAPANLHDWLDALFDAPDAGHVAWQRVAAALAVRGGLTVITGGPGTGKTTTVVGLLGLLQGIAADNGTSLRIRLAAPTGKAAGRLTESIGQRVAALPVADALRAAIPSEVTTLHRLLGRRPGSRHFRHDHRNPVHADVVVVDEASMIDLEMMACLLDALAPQTRLILLGDKDQLASVEAGAVMGDVCRGAEAGNYDEATAAWLHNTAGEDVGPWRGCGGALAQQTVMLRTSHRFGAASGIGALAAAVNAGDQDAVAAAWQADYTDLERIELTGLTDARLERLAVAGYQPCLEALAHLEPDESPEAPARRALEAFGAFQLLCALREGPAGVDAINTRVAQALHREGLIPRPDGWYPGRPVMVTRNDYQLGLMNGDVGITVPVTPEDGPRGLRVGFPQADGALRLVLPSRLPDVVTAYAMTVHKAQGSEFTHTALLLPETDSPVLTRELLYTAVTRASQRFTLLQPATANVLADAVARRTRRASGLAAALAAGPPTSAAGTNPDESDDGGKP